MVWATFSQKCERNSGETLTFEKKKTLKTGEMLKLSRFLGLLGHFGSIDPENKDNFDNFNISPVLSVFFLNVKVLLRFGRHFGENVAETAGKL